MSSIIFYLPFLILFTMGAVYAERKIAALIQDRLGPMEVGYKGLAQSFADLLKLLQKEIIIPASANRALFIIAPAWILITVIAAFAVLPVTNSWAGARTSTGVLYLLAMVALAVIGILMAGWASNNKYARFGAMRAIAQTISYEIPLSISILCVVVVRQTLDLQTISWQQSIGNYSSEFNTPVYFLGIHFLEVTRLGGFFSWNIFSAPVLFFSYIIFFISSLAACHRAPFDLPESDSEIIGGYHTEYGGIYWAWMMLSEYGMMLLMSLLGVILFLGSWNTPLPNLGSFSLAFWTSGTPGSLIGNFWAMFWLFSKAILLIAIKIWIRWTFPRVRFDHLIRLCWIYLIPASLAVLLITAMFAKNL